MDDETHNDDGGGGAVLESKRTKHTEGACSRRYFNSGMIRKKSGSL